MIDVQAMNINFAVIAIFGIIYPRVGFLIILIIAIFSYHQHMVTP